MQRDLFTVATLLNSNHTKHYSLECKLYNVLITRGWGGAVKVLKPYTVLVLYWFSYTYMTIWLLGMESTPPSDPQPMARCPFQPHFTHTLLKALTIMGRFLLHIFVEQCCQVFYQVIILLVIGVNPPRPT